MLLAALEALILSVKWVSLCLQHCCTVNIDKPIMSWSWSIHHNLLNHTSLNQRSWHCVKWPSAIVCSLVAHTIQGISHSVPPSPTLCSSRENCFNCCQLSVRLIAKKLKFHIILIIFICTGEEWRPNTDVLKVEFSSSFLFFLCD